MIRIPEPCGERWEEMQPNGCGRFCAQCQKTLIDFSVLTDGEIANLLQKNAGQALCGNFLSTQLDRPIPASDLPKASTLKSKAAAVLLFLASGTASLNLWGQGKAGTTQTTGEQAPQTGARPIRIRGSIRDARDQAPLLRMAITIEGAGTQYSDRKGRFNFTLPVDFAGKTITIRAAYRPLSSPEAAGTALLEETVVLEPGRNHYTVQLFRYPAETIQLDREPGNEITTTTRYITKGVLEPIVVHRPPKEGLWHRFKRTFKSKPKH